MRKLSSYGPGLVVLGTAIIVLLAGPSAVWHLTYVQTKARIIQASESLDSNPILQQINQAYRDIAMLVEPSVVHISTERTVHNRFGEARLIGSSGSGWIWDEAGHIVTNYHVIQESERIEVQLSTGELREAEIVGSDPFTDIAVIKVPAGRLFPALRTNPDGTDADGYATVQQGDRVFAFGSPFDFRFSMSSGVVSGIGRSVGVIRDDRGRWLGYENFIQVDAAINPGNSGGPLTDARGRVIGMNTAIATGSNGGNALDEGQFAGIGLAIPMDMIEPAVMQIINTGEVQKGFLGVSVLDKTANLARELTGLGFSGYGLTVARLEPDNPAVSAGLQVGDVITQIDGRDVQTLAQANRITGSLDSDAQVTLTVWRYNESRDNSTQHKIWLPGLVVKGFRGIWLLQIDDLVADWLSVQGFAGRGVRIAHLELDRPARRAGLRHRDVVTHVNGDPVGSVAQLRSRISSMLPGETASLAVWRFDGVLGEGRTLNIEVELDRLDPLQATGVLPRNEGEGALRRVGIERLRTSTPELADEYDVRYEPGVMVLGVVPGSPIEGRIPIGSTIVAVMDRPVGDREEFFDQMETYDLRDSRGVWVRILRPDGTLGQVLLRME